MAAESLEKAGRLRCRAARRDPGLRRFDPLDPQIIADADAVIFAADVEVREKERFAGKPPVDVGREAGIDGPPELITEARAAAAAGPPAGERPGGGRRGVGRATRSTPATASAPGCASG